MASIFSITTATNNIPIGTGRIATALFTVSNRSSQPLIGRAVLVMDPPNESQSNWLRLKPPQESERNFDAHGVQDYLVEVNVPVGALAGEYIFHLDMEDTANPDETYTVGPTVLLEVAQTEPPKPEKKPFPWWIILVGLSIVGLGLGFFSHSFAVFWSFIVAVVVAPVVLMIISRLNLGVSVANFKSALIAGVVIAVVGEVIIWLLGAYLGFVFFSQVSRINFGYIINLGTIIYLIIATVVLMISHRFLSGITVNGFRGAIIAAIAIAVAYWLVFSLLNLLLFRF
jgi:putative membrane protein